MQRIAQVLLVAAPVIGFGIAAPTDSRPRRSAPPTVVAEQLLTTVTLTRKWAEFLYAIRPPVQNGCEPFESKPVFDEDGTLHQTVIDEDCTRTELTVRPDFSYTMDILYSNGLREEVSIAPFEFLPPPLEFVPRTFAIVHEFSNGNHAAYTHELDWMTEDFSVEAEHISGSFTLQDDKLTFALDRVHSFDSPPDRFRATLPGGVDYTLDIPRDPFELRLDFSIPAEGVLKLPEGALPFRLIATNPDTDRRWDRLEVGTKGARRRGAVNGTFVLERNFSGGGQMFRGKRLDFVVRWNRGQTGQVVLPNGTSTTAGPAEGLLAFLNLRWSGLASGFGPSPGL